MSQSQELATKDAEQIREITRHEPSPVTLFGDLPPGDLVKRMTSYATALGNLIKAQNLFIQIGAKRHVLVEGWTALGSMLGVFPVPVWTRPVPVDWHRLGLQQPLGWEARVEARMLNGVVIGAADAECLRSEERWKDREDFQLRSMCQTRATSKALKLPLSFVVALAGYDPTPAEEVTWGEQSADEHRTTTSSAPATDKQLGAISAIADDNQLDKAARLEAVGRVIGRTIESTKELTKSEASKVIDTWKKSGPGTGEAKAPPGVVRTVAEPATPSSDRTEHVPSKAAMVMTDDDIKKFPSLAGVPPALREKVIESFAGKFKLADSAIQGLGERIDEAQIEELLKSRAGGQS